ncbi:DnaB-like helicase N-terminal domain-containing protein [Streptomyces sp. NPDC020965]|uniref:DnaB-like helicase N-terminal domain-containing protein n=1 Tax=Streptomyces sp. NPDC020965 TaxID=3365105 RepID=UPI0037A21F14
MPDTIDPCGDGTGAGPDDPEPSPPVHYAEQALLGALLLEPHRLGTLGSLGAAQFGDPAHAALFAAMGALAPPEAAVHASEPVWLSSVLDHARRDARGLTAAYLHALVQACPDPRHTAAYTQMIRADHARRTLRTHAGSLAQTATVPVQPDPASAVLAQADTLARYLDDLTGQFAPHPGSLPRTPAPPDPPRNTGSDVLDEERLLLATATAHPGEMARMRWLLPVDFALPVHAALFHCLTALAHRGEPIDPVTVLWEAQHRGLLRDTAPAHILNLLATPAGSVEHWGGKVLQRALLHQARTTANLIRSYADDPANSVHQLVTGSRRALADLTAVRARWQHQHHAPQPPNQRQTPRTTAAARAGPLRTTAPSSPARTSR